MSKEYIEREAALKAMSQAIQDRTWSMDDFDVMIKMEDYVADLPAADVAPVVHGEWVYDHWCEFKCSECGQLSNSIPFKAKERYCPNCGARMDGGK